MVCAFVDPCLVVLLESRDYPVVWLVEGVVVCPAPGVLESPPPPDPLKLKKKVGAGGRMLFLMVSSSPRSCGGFCPCFLTRVRLSQLILFVWPILTSISRAVVSSQYSMVYPRARPLHAEKKVGRLLCASVSASKGSKWTVGGGGVVLCP